MDDEDGKSYKSSWSWARDMNISRPATPSARSTGAESTISRASTPKWWRPSYPPETYLWEEVRRKRKRGGYPWTYLDREMAELSDNLYEPVNPRPYYGSGDMKQDPETTSLDDRLIDIPPELDIVTSEGLDGLDQLDSHDYGFDGEKEWNHYPEEMGDAHVPKTFTAGIRKELPKYGETSSERPLMTKTGGTGEGDQEVPSLPTEEQAGAMSNALTQLKQKADQVKKQLSKISLPAPPKFNNWAGLMLSKKKRKAEEGVGAEDDEEIFEPVQAPESGAEGMDQTSEHVQKTKPPKPPPPKQAGIMSKFFEADSSKANETTKSSEMTTSLSRPKSPTKEEKTKKDKDVEKGANQAVVDEPKVSHEAKEKHPRGKSPADVKRQQKQEEKLAKEKAQEEAKGLKAEEKAAKEKAKEEKKKAEAEDKILRKKQEEELKRAKQEEERKQAEVDAEAKRIQMEKSQAEPPKLQGEQVQQIQVKVQPTKPQVVQPSTSSSAQLELQVGKELQEKKGKKAKQRETVQGLEAPAEQALKLADEAASTPKEKKPNRAEVIKRKLADIDFTKKFKRSKTPPGRHDEPPKLKYKKSGLKDDETDNKLAAQYAQEILRRDAEMEMEKEKEKEREAQRHKLQEPVIFVTQPSVETTDTESHSTDLRPNPLHYENVPESEAPQKQKFGDKMKGFGHKSKVIASTTSKNLGQKMKVFGHDLKQFGGKVNVKCHETIKEIKATQEAAKKRSQEAKEAKALAQAAEAAEKGTQEQPEKSPRTSFRFKRRPLNDEETVTKQSVEPVVVAKTRRKKKPLSQEFHEYLEQHPDEDGQGQKQQSKINRHEVLGHADRDWESPMDLVRSRDPSEEPFSGRYSPPGSSTASSRRQGVLEEIDSDEFFLRERGISEGEDEEEVNRLLMHELRQTFRPLDNSLRGFDMPSPPPRPARSPRKPPRRAGAKDSNFQTFPPERPKRKQTPGYISSYLNQEQQKQDGLEGDQLRMSEEDEFLALESDEDEGIRRVKLELRRIDQDMEDEKIRYEPVLTESPLKPRRSKKGRSKPKENEPTASEERPQIFYYNTIGANEWMKKVEAQIEGSAQSDTAPPAPENPPVAPRRVRRKSEGGKSAKSEGGKSGKSEAQFSDIDNTAVGPTINIERQEQDDMASLSVQLDRSEDTSTLPATLDLDVDDSIEYVDYEEDPGGGYAMVVQKKFSVEKGLPKTVPRRKQQRDKFDRKSHSLKRRSQEGDQNEAGVSNPVFCSLPRFTPRTFHIVPPTRPHRNYSSLKPKRPSRQGRSGKPAESQGPSRPPPPIGTRANPRLGARDDLDERGGSTTPNVGSIQGRPLPPPPRPQRSPGPLNDLDHSTIERMVGIRHYANFVGDDGDGRVPVVEELVVAKNIPLLGRGEDPNVGESNVGVQTDPVQGEEEIDLNAVGSFEDEDEGIDKQRDSVYRTSSSDGQEVRQAAPAQRAADRPSSQRVAAAAAPSTEVIFPSRLHLDELEVDFLRVNELTAQSITMDHLHAPQLYVDSMSSSGALIVPLIQSSTLAVDQVNTERVCTTDLSSSIPPASFHQLAASPPQLNEESVQRIKTSEQFGRTTSPSTTASPEQPPTQTARRSSADDVLRQTARLGRAILSSAMRGLDNLTDYLDAATSNDPECHAQQRSQIQILMCMLLVLVIGIYLLSGSSPSNPRWEFFLPPPDL